MKKNIDYYPHKTESHRHPKFKMLRSMYENLVDGWAAEGRFWALNNLIAGSEDCKLDLRKKRNKGVFADELGMSIGEFEQFVELLVSEDVELLTEIEADVYTTETVQETYESISGERQRARKNKQKSLKSDGYEEKEESYTELSKSSPEPNNKVNKSEVKGIKVNKIKVNESEHFLKINSSLKKLYTDHTKIKDPNQLTHLDPILEIFERIPELLTVEDIWDCVVETFKSLNEQMNIRVDYLCDAINLKVITSLEKKQNVDKSKVKKEANTLRIEAKNEEIEQKKKEKSEMLNQFKEFFNKNPGDFNEMEKVKILHYLNKNDLFSLERIILPKMESVGLG